MCKNIQEYFNMIKNEAILEGKIEVIATYLSNGGSEEDAIRMLNASSEELEKAKELLINV